ncbi:CheW protein [Stanieria cyanosphaera PCC 7437]|uniref:CheW protein n=1 Tax=Stanieria cyanosphaera (strain ATCC 29371 / PCC 7437) TaxID=111780 RepID=K9XZJ2_STAC7|nr:chemotaxis protein CheW [Stanieria cyanosphaera]AFZ37546.1 CheW protein [Stanieria cyanosphaera PCC 7437]
MNLSNKKTLLPATKAFTSLANSEEMLQFGNRLQQNGERFLKFSLNTEINALVSLSDLRGVVDVTLKEILPVPQIAEFLLGIMNWQGEAIWIIDLANLLGAVHWSRRSPMPQSGMVLLVELENHNHKIGLLVEQIKGIEIYERQFCCSVSQLSSLEPLHGFLQGYFLDADGNSLMLLDVRAITTVLQT